jgi:hypothetical protein
LALAATALALPALAAPALAADGSGSGSGQVNPAGMSPRTSSAAVGIDRGNEQTAFHFLLGKGLTAEQAAGVVGNLDQESGMDPTSKQDGGGPGRGIAQWGVGGRWDTDKLSGKIDNVKDYAASRGEQATSLGLQLDFTWYELSTFADPNRFHYGLPELRSATTIDAAVEAFETYFERCNPKYCATATREAYAQTAYRRYARPPENWGASAVRAGSAYDVFWMNASGHVLQSSWRGAGWRTQSLGGVLSASPAATRSGDRYDVFGVSPSGKLYQRSYYGRSWGSWHAVASGFVGGVSAFVASGGYHVFGHDTAGHVIEASWVGHGWHVVSLGGKTAGTPATTAAAGGRYDVFAVSPSGKVYQRTHYGRSWGSWHAVASGFTEGLSAVRAGTDYHVFGHDPAGQLRQAYWAGHGWHAQDLRGKTDGTPGSSYLAARYDAFAVSPSGKLYQRTYHGGSWGRWHRVAAGR